MALGSTQPLVKSEYQEYPWGLRQPVHKADNLPPYCAAVKKSGSLYFSEPSGPVQACYRTVLPIFYLLTKFSAL